MTPCPAAGLACRGGLVMSNPYEQFCSVVDEAAHRLGLADAAFVHRIVTPERIHQVAIPLAKDDGSTALLTGYRVQHSSLLGPYKGGVRYHARARLSEVMALAGWMSIKNAVVNIPFGGGKGAITVDPRRLSVRELEALTRGYVERIWRDIGPRVDILAPDVNTGSRVMDWAADEYCRLSEAQARAVATGKSLAAGGSPGRDTATAQGGYEVLVQALERRGERLDGMTVAVQGFGNAGANVAVLLAGAGARVVAASDSTAALFSAAGLPVDELLALKRSGGRFVDVRDLESGPPPSVLGADVDILVPAALEGQITAGTAGAVRARYVLELANGPTTPEADRELGRRGTLVLPDVLANAGGVVVSSFEWAQNVHAERWTREEVGARLATAMRRAYATVADLAGARGISLRLAAYGVAIERLRAAVRTEPIAPEPMLAALL